MHAVCSRPPACLVRVCECPCLQVPPLRVRPRDIRSLQRFFLHELQKQRADLGSGGPVQLTDDAVRQLEAYSYPLNITELRTMVERAASQVGVRAGG